MQDPKCPHCKRTLEGYYEFHRTFFKCICGKEWKGYNPGRNACSEKDIVWQSH